VVVLVAVVVVMVIQPRSLVLCACNMLLDLRSGQEVVVMIGLQELIS